jgi:putative intracellular protease/amidase
VMLGEGLDGGLSPEALRDAVGELESDSQALADERKARLDAIDGFRSPVALSALSDEQLAEFDAVFVPGGHAPMVDLPDSQDVGRLLAVLQAKNAPIASLCHGVAMLLSAPERADGQWLFEGYRLTSFTDEEEDQTRPGKIGLTWYLDTTLKNAGAVFDDAPFAWGSHVVVDRNLVTGQNPNSTEATADAVLKALDL